MSEAKAPDTETRPNGEERQHTLLIVTVIFLLCGVGAWAYWFFHSRWIEDTNDAYVTGDTVFITARIPGTVVSLQGHNTESVKTGQVLVTLDDSDAKVQLQRAASALALAVRQYRQQSEQSAQLDSAIDAQKLELARAREDLARREPLLSAQAVASEEVAHARNAVLLAQNALTQTQRQAQSLHAMLSGTTVRTSPAVQSAKAEYISAWLNLHRTQIVAPVDGQITQHNIELGQHIQPGQTLMSIVPLNNLWIDANFKETQLKHLRLGQPVDLVSDIYGNSFVYRGKVAGISAGTGAAFALLPAQNASGNWIKVTQRVPVRIELDPRELAEHPLRIGLSMTVTVSTRDRAGTPLSGAADTANSKQTEVLNNDLDAINKEIEHIIAAQLG